MKQFNENQQGDQIHQTGFSDAELIGMAKYDKEQFALIYDRYFADIFRFVYSRVETEHIADDLTSLVFYKAFKSIDKFEYTGVPLIVWLCKIARNEINQEFRKKKYTRVINVKSDKIKDVVDEEVNDQDLWNQLMELLAKLDDADIELIEMKYFDGLSYEQMSQILNIPESNLKMKIYRIKKRLKEYKNTYSYEK